MGIMIDQSNASRAVQCDSSLGPSEKWWGGKGPKAVISIKDLNATFETEKIGNPHGLQITYRREGHIRNLFVYHESGKPAPPDSAGLPCQLAWLPLERAIGATQSEVREDNLAGTMGSSLPSVAKVMVILRTSLWLSSDLRGTHLHLSDLVPLITRKYLKQGFMEKTGPKQREPFKKRWFALDPQERRLLYYKNPLDAFEQGQVFLGSNEQGYGVYEDLPKGIRGNRWKAGLTIVTPERRFIFTCPSEKEQREWLESFQDVLSRPLTPLNLISKMHSLSFVLSAKGRRQNRGLTGFSWEP
ncbi:hypothetical protein GH733_013995 [Mirounga leonina]|nr:hypothetical protein GH733_013995 [Mirounga leonina]